MEYETATIVIAAAILLGMVGSIAIAAVRGHQLTLVPETTV